MPNAPSLPEFISRWRGATLTERGAAQSHFVELCHVFGELGPAEADPTGTFFAFEKGVQRVGGGGGFADVWKRGYFAWEYKGRHRNLVEAYQQLLTYREDLENPPLLVVCDLDRFEVHTNYTGTVKRVYRFTLADLGSAEPLPDLTLSAVDVIRAVLTDPARLRPQQTSTQVTEAAAREFATLATSLNRAGAQPEFAARFLMRLLFCLFAEDIDLLPPNLFTMLVAGARNRPGEFSTRVRGLFAAMASGGSFGPYDIAYFDGGLFAQPDDVPMTAADLEVLHRACQLDWGSIEPAIFGTLFERSLDPAKRSQLGAHYTSREDILLIVEPILMAPLRQEWNEVKTEAAVLIARRDAATGAARTRHQQAFIRLLGTFSTRLSAVKILDPACGSGNFLYVALKQLLDLEKEVSTYGASHGSSAFIQQVSPNQLFGIELDIYAHELAQVVVWIGYIQWLHDNGSGSPPPPILRPLTNIEQKDSILAYGEDGRPVEPNWPEGDVIIGNPPFLGGKRLRAELSDRTVDDLFALYVGRVAREADLVCYWYERAREQIAAGKARRAGLLATNSIRGGANRRSLDRIKETGNIFMAWSDRPWVLDGAAVRVSMVGFDDGSQTDRSLDGAAVSAINSDLTSAVDLTRAKRLAENLNLAFMGDTKGGAFDLSPAEALPMLRAPLNPNGRFNGDVVRPWVNGLDLTRRPRGMWIIDFGTGMSDDKAALYELPFNYIVKHVKPDRLKNNREAYRLRWWIHIEARPGMREALRPLRRFICTPRVSKFRVFVWLDQPTLPDSATIAVARDDDYFFGVLQSRVHEAWSLGLGTWLGVGNDPRYTPTTTFETFPFPWPPGREPLGDHRHSAITEAARELAEIRSAWLNPPGALVAELEGRTLTKLYNGRPAFLRLAHEKLDRAVLDAYGWPQDLTDEQILERLLVLNGDRAAATGLPSS